MIALGQLIAALSAVLGLLGGGPRCNLPEADYCLEAMAQVATLVPMRCTPEAMAYHGAGTASGEYYNGTWEAVNGLPEEVVIYYTAEQRTQDPAAVVAYHRTVIAHELGHSWWITHATPAQRAGLQDLMGWTWFDEEAAADLYAMAATTEWRDYWGGWAAEHPTSRPPTPEDLVAMDLLDLVPELGEFASFAPMEVAP